MPRYYTVEYDGYTYKKPEEKEEKERATGSKYLLGALGCTEAEKEEIKKVIVKLGKRSKWKDLSEKQERVYLKMEKILSKLKTYSPFSTPFLTKVSKREAPEYYTHIEQPMDLGKMSKKIEQQEYSDVNDFINDLELIWSNCFKFNTDHGNIYAMYAQKMKEKALLLLQDLFAEREVEVPGPPEEVAHFLATEKERKELTALRVAILQHPSEFTAKRTPGSMGEYWRQERTIPSQGSDPLRPFIPEYTYFYNSFPVEGEKKEEVFCHSLDEIDHRNPGHREGRVCPQDPGKKKSLLYQNGQILHGGEPLNTLGIGYIEACLLLKKTVSLDLLSIGFTATESSALDILVTYTVQQIDKVLKVIKRHSLDSHSAILLVVINTFNLKSTDLTTISFFSDSEEDSSEETLLDLMYSDVDGIEQLDEII
ncbi:hypothetical protein NEDG_01903 [Nematocida displodere]|uniref:Bromo domain-containing protein n=1 Tax=Nematocida displodere TaxID=1805483 RepID=A0A177EJG3_9MICR|nr:hypothetical protein NEDG_01903 [Nematocida displodere]